MTPIFPTQTIWIWTMIEAHVSCHGLHTHAQFRGACGVNAVCWAARPREQDFASRVKRDEDPHQHDAGCPLVGPPEGV